MLKKGKVERFNHYLRYSFHNGLRVKLTMKNYEMNIDNANSEVLKWLDNQANVRIHSTTLQQPMKLLQEEQPHLLSLPKPYNGIHPRSINDIIVKDNSIINTNVPVSVITIPHRDLQGYDDLIQSTAFIVPPLLYTTSVYLMGA